MRKTPFVLAVLGTLLLTAACRGGPNDPDDQLGEREARNLMPNFLAASWRSMEKHLADHAADPNRAPGAFAHVEACPQGGEIRINGTITLAVEEASGARIVNMNATKSPTNCTFSEDGRIYSLGGSAPLNVLGIGRIVGSQPGAAQVSESGDFTWQVDTRSGVCSVNLSAAIDTRLRTGLLTGTACRRTLNDSIDWLPLAGG